MSDKKDDKHPDPKPHENPSTASDSTPPPPTDPGVVPTPGLTDEDDDGDESGD